LPVMENGKLVGMVTETDIFDSFIDILGVKTAHTRIDCYIAERPGTIGEITKLFGDKGMNIINTVVYFDERKKRYKLILRAEELNCDEVLAELKQRGYEVESVIVYKESI
ncbi:MAG TPA: histidine kinase, partial [Syntrophomonas sp.]|nr:histidine kinase [Syntrophomonas sp.]